MTDTFDFVVVGAGSGGCAVAGRLSEDAATSVALLDAGGTNDNWVVTTPGALVLMVAGTVNNWAFNTVPQKGLNGRIGYQPRGKGLGGSSAINAMVYIRGHRADYDHWAALGNTGWAFADVLPYFKRSEDNSDFDGEYHGKGGPLAVNKLRSGNPIQQTFLQAAQEAQFRIREDFNAEDHEGLGIYQVTQRNGERWSAARAYVHPHIGRRTNLRVETNAHATRILFEGKRAVGVEYRQGKEVKQLRARREVLLASGAFQSPQLLMLSGVGDAAALGRHGLASVHHLPGVGQNLQDHPDFIFGYMSDNPNFAGISLKGMPRLVRAIMQYRRERRGPLTSNFAECGGFLKTRPDLDIPDIQLHFGMAMVDDHGRKRHGGTGFSCHVCLLRPKSRGSVALAGSDPMQAPLIDPNFLGEEDDLESMGGGLQDHTAADGGAGTARPAAEGCVHIQRPHRRRHPQHPARARRHRLSPGRHLQDGHRRSARGGRSEAARARARRPARGRRLDHADLDRRQHQCTDHHDRREGGGYDQGGDAGGVTKCRRKAALAKYRKQPHAQ
ncbi:choline dehydrogenase-like flavoprotein [Bradyrhizobium elkanii]